MKTKIWYINGDKIETLFYPEVTITQTHIILQDSRINQTKIISQARIAKVEINDESGDMTHPKIPSVSP